MSGSSQASGANYLSRSFSGASAITLAGWVRVNGFRTYNLSRTVWIEDQ